MAVRWVHGDTMAQKGLSRTHGPTLSSKVKWSRAGLIGSVGIMPFQNQCDDSGVVVFQGGIVQFRSSHAVRHLAEYGSFHSNHFESRWWLAEPALGGRVLSQGT